MGGNKSPPTFVKGMIKLTKKRKSKYTLYRNRVLASMRRIKKKGYTFDDLYFPTEREIRKSGVKGQELRYLTLRLKKLTSKEIIKLARRIEETFENERLIDTNEFYEYSVIENFRSQVIRYPKGFATQLIAWINRVVKEKGIKSAAKMLQDGFSSGLEITAETMYKENSFNKFIDAMMNFIPDVGELEKAKILEMVDEDVYQEFKQRGYSRYN